MQFRGTLASLMTVILLSLSSFAANCAIRCDLQSAVGSCHGASHGGQQGTMQPMAGMDHSAVMPPTAAFPAVSPNSADCRHHVCAQQLVVMNEQQAALTHVTVDRGLTAPDPARLASQPDVEVLFDRGPPRFCRATPISLHTTLLI